MKKDPEFGEFWQIIYDEFLESKRLLLKIAGQSSWRTILTVKHPFKSESVSFAFVNTAICFIENKRNKDECAR
jgi:hypothetical protein